MVAYRRPWSVFVERRYRRFTHTTCGSKEVAEYHGRRVWVHFRHDEKKGTASRVYIRHRMTGETIEIPRALKGPR